jgi:hypothetical protein
VQEDATYIFDEFKLVSGFRYSCGKTNIKIAKTATKQGDKGKTILTYWFETKKVLNLDPCYGKVPPLQM